MQMRCFALAIFFQQRLPKSAERKEIDIIN